MYKLIPGFFLLLMLGCSTGSTLDGNCLKEVQIDIPTYYNLIKEAENQICKQDYAVSIKTYESAFQLIKKPFGKDVFNAALVAGLSNNSSRLKSYLQVIINNSDELDHIKDVFVPTYLKENSWEKLILERKVCYDAALRTEFDAIVERDQIFRPQYDVYDDTINTNRKINMKRILEVSKASGFPSHQELGYQDRFWGQAYYIVLHHTSQRRSRDKTVMDMEGVLREAVEVGRFDPEFGIFYMAFQNDLGKGIFEVYSTWKYQHKLLPDSLNQKIWLKDISPQMRKNANEKRQEWHANSLEEIEIKTAFLNKTELPFVFTSVRKSTSLIHESYSKEQALEEYKLFTGFYKEYVSE